MQKLIDDMIETMARVPRRRAGGAAGARGGPAVRAHRSTSERGEEPTRAGGDHQPRDHAGRRSEIVEDWEGCLSIPDIRGRVPRHAEIEVRALDRDGERIEMRAADFSARVIQHETDHLDGILFFDRMRAFETLTFLDEYSRYWVKHDDDDEE